MSWMDNTLSDHLMYIIGHITLRNFDSFYFDSRGTHIIAERNVINMPLGMMDHISKILQQSNIYFKIADVTWNSNNKDLKVYFLRIKYHPNILSHIKKSFLKYAIKDVLYEE